MATLKDFVVRYNELAREERISTFSKGDLMKMAYGETYRNVDSALPMGMLEEEGISKDEYWHYVMDYNNNGAFGRLTDLFDVIAKKNPTIEVYNDMYELTDTLPILDAVKKYENQDILWQIKRSDKSSKYASGSTIEDHEASWVNACMKNHSKEECFIIILKDSQFSSYIGKPKNEYTHNRLPKKAIVTKNSVSLTTYTPNTGRHLDTIEFTDPTKLLKYLNKNQIMAKGSTVKGSDVSGNVNRWKKYAIVVHFKDGLTSYVGYNTESSFLQGVEDFNNDKDVKSIEKHQNADGKGKWEKYAKGSTVEGESYSITFVNSEGKTKSIFIGGKNEQEAIKNAEIKLKLQPLTWSVSSVSYMGKYAKGSTVKGFKKGDKVKTREGNIETVIRVNSNGNIETQESDYTHNPQTLELIPKHAKGSTVKGVYELLSQESINSFIDYSYKNYKEYGYNKEEFKNAVNEFLSNLNKTFSKGNNYDWEEEGLSHEEKFRRFKNFQDDREKVISLLYGQELRQYIMKRKINKHAKGSTVKDNRMNERTRAVILKIQKTRIHPNDVSPNFVSEVADENGINLSSKEVVFISDNYSKKFGNGGGVAVSSESGLAVGTNADLLMNQQNLQYANGGGVGEISKSDIDKIFGTMNTDFGYDFDGFEEFIMLNKSVVSDMLKYNFSTKDISNALNDIQEKYESLPNKLISDWGYEPNKELYKLVDDNKVLVYDLLGKEMSTSEIADILNDIETKGQGSKYANGGNTTSGFNYEIGGL
jgi:hypothetical protein